MATESIPPTNSDPTYLCLCGIGFDSGLVYVDHVKSHELLQTRQLLNEYRLEAAEIARLRAEVGYLKVRLNEEHQAFLAEQVAGQEARAEVDCLTGQTERHRALGRDVKSALVSLEKHKEGEHSVADVDTAAWVAAEILRHVLANLQPESGPVREDS